MTQENLMQRSSVSDRVPAVSSASVLSALQSPADGAIFISTVAVSVHHFYDMMNIATGCKTQRLGTTCSDITQ